MVHWLTLLPSTQTASLNKPTRPPLYPIFLPGRRGYLMTVTGLLPLGITLSLQSRGQAFPERRCHFQPRATFPFKKSLCRVSLAPSGWPSWRRVDEPPRIAPPDQFALLATLSGCATPIMAAVLGAKGFGDGSHCPADIISAIPVQSICAVVTKA